jgi:hypothetical protein
MSGELSSIIGDSRTTGKFFVLVAQSMFIYAALEPDG